LPSYPFSTAQFWVGFKDIAPDPPLRLDAESGRSDLISKYFMLHSWSQFPSEANGRVAIFETPIEDLGGFIQEHTVGGFHLCPASVYLEQVLAGIDLAKNHLMLPFPNDRVTLRDTEFIKPLVYVERISRIVTSSITCDMDGSGIFTVSSRADGYTEDVVHAHGNFRHQSHVHTEKKFSYSLPFVIRQIAAVARPADGTPPETFMARTVYELIFPRIVDYGMVYRTIQSLTVDTNGMEARAIIKLPSNIGLKYKFIAHPAFMDSLFHVAGFVANLQGGLDDAYICNAAGSVRVIPELIDEAVPYCIYCCSVWLSEGDIMLADTYAVSKTEPKRIVACLKGLQFRRVRFDSFKHSRAALLPQPFDTTKESKCAFIMKSQISAQPSCPKNIRDSTLIAEVTRIVSLTCDVDSTTFDIHTDLASLGVDSLLSIEIFAKLHALFPHTRLNCQSLAFCRTITEIAEKFSPQHTHKVYGMSPSSTLVSNISGIDWTIDEQVTLNAKGAVGSILGVCSGTTAADASADNFHLDSSNTLEALRVPKHSLGHDFTLKHSTTQTTVGGAQSFLSHDHANTRLSCATEAAKVLQSRIDPESIVKAFRLGDVPVSIQRSSASGHFPLFLIHDGSGLISYYDRLSPMGRDVWGIHNPHFMNEIPWP